MKTALITGITGQDGSYLAELLLKKGYRVIGTVRSLSTALNIIPCSLAQSVELAEWDMLDQHKMVELLIQYRPSELYNFAAYSSGERMFDEATSIADINGLAITRILDSIRSVDSDIKFCQASSSEIFGAPLDSPQSEETRFNPRTPYGAAKLYAHFMIDVYRRRYGLFACSAILFNHESPRRRLEFVTRKISHTAAQIKLGLVGELKLGNLDARRDWGYSKDYVRAMWLMLQHKHPNDYVVATGITHSVRQLCEYAFTHLDLDYRDYVHVDSASYRPDEATQLVGDPSRIRDQLGWQPQCDVISLIQMMVDEDLRSLRDKMIINQVGE